MAWWKNPEGQPTPPVTRERVAAWFDARGYRYKLSEDGRRIDSGFSVFPYSVGLDKSLMVIHSRFWTNLPPNDAQTTAAVRSLLRDYHLENGIPCLATCVDGRGRQIEASVAVDVAAGLHDDQLDDILTTCLQCVMSAFSELAEAMGIDPEARLRGHA